jgi:hypothetical protein
MAQGLLCECDVGYGPRTIAEKWAWKDGGQVEILFGRPSLEFVVTQCATTWSPGILRVRMGPMLRRVGEHPINLF